MLEGILAQSRTFFLLSVPNVYLWKSNHTLSCTRAQIMCQIKQFLIHLSKKDFSESLDLLKGDCIFHLQSFRNQVEIWE